MVNSVPPRAFQLTRKAGFSGFNDTQTAGSRIAS